MADVITGTTQTSATAMDIIAAEVQEVLNANIVMPGIVLDASRFVEPGAKSVKIPKMGAFTVTKKTSGTAVDAQINALSTDQLNLDQHGVVQFLLEDIASLQSRVAVTQEYVAQAAKDLASEMDQYMIDALESGVSTASPDHKVAYANSGTDNDLGKADFIEARRLLNVAKVPQSDRAVVISPTSEAAILAIDGFVKVNESGSEQALRNGQIGKLFGFDVIMSQQVEDAKSLFLHKSALAFARQLAPRVEKQRDLANIADRWSMDHIYGAKTLDAGKRVVLMGTA
jgi:hypothetical protein